MTRKQQTFTAFITGVAFLLLLLYLVSTTSCPSAVQKFIYHVILSLSAAAFAVVIPGVLSLQLNNGVTAGGALGVLAIVFLFVPKDFYSACPPKQLAAIRGQVLVNGKALKDVVVSVPVLESRVETNDFGVFEVRRFPGQEQGSYQLSITYNSKEFVVDTTITVKDDPTMSSLLLAVTSKPRAQEVVPVQPLQPDQDPVLTSYEYHTFTDGVFGSIEYGGGSFCSYTAHLKDLKLTVALDKDRSALQFASLSYSFSELSPSCPYPTIAANLNTYTLTDWRVNGDAVELDFQPDPSNLPQCAVKVMCIRTNRALRGHMTVRRFDSSEVFNFKEDVPVVLDLDTP